MTANNGYPSIADSEVLARFIKSKRQVRSDGTVKPDAFMPPKSLELSVSRHGGRPESELWVRGTEALAKSGQVLIGRADIAAEAVRGVEPLDVVGAPIPEEDEGHAHIIGWPPMSEKPAQKNLALSLAGTAEYISVP